MSERKLNPRQWKIRQLVLDIMDNAMIKSQETESDVFTRYSAHVNSFEVYIYKYGWDYNADPNWELDIYLGSKSKETEEDVIKKLEECLETIKLL